MMESMEAHVLQSLAGLVQKIATDCKIGLPLFEELLAKTSKLQVQLVSTTSVLSSFLDTFQKIADAASSTKGSSTDIGICLTRIVIRHRAMEARLKTLTRALSDCLTLPVQSKVEEWRSLVKAMEKEHTREFKKMRSIIKKKSDQLIKLRKKMKKENSVETGNQCDQAVKDLSNTIKKFEEKEKQVVKKIAMQERVHYTVLAASFKPVIAEEHEMLLEIEHLTEVMDKLNRIISDPKKSVESTDNVVNQINGTEDRFCYSSPPGSPSGSTMGSRRGSIRSLNSLASSRASSRASSSSRASQQESLRSRQSSVSSDTESCSKENGVNSRDSVISNRSQDSGFSANSFSLSLLPLVIKEDDIEWKKSYSYSDYSSPRCLSARVGGSDYSAIPGLRRGEGNFSSDSLRSLYGDTVTGRPPVIPSRPKPSVPERVSSLDSGSSSGSASSVSSPHRPSGSASSPLDQTISSSSTVHAVAASSAPSAAAGGNSASRSSSQSRSASVEYSTATSSVPRSASTHSHIHPSSSSAATGYMLSASASASSLLRLSNNAASETAGEAPKGHIYPAAAFGNCPPPRSCSSISSFKSSASELSEVDSISLRSEDPRMSINNYERLSLSLHFSPETDINGDDCGSNGTLQYKKTGKKTSESISESMPESASLGDLSRTAGAGGGTIIGNGANMAMSEYSVPRKSSFSNLSERREMVLNLPIYANTKNVEATRGRLGNDLMMEAAGRSARLGSDLDCEEDMVTPTLEQLSILDEKVEDQKSSGSGSMGSSSGYGSQIAMEETDGWNGTFGEAAYANTSGLLSSCGSTTTLTSNNLYADNTECSSNTPINCPQPLDLSIALPPQHSASHSSTPQHASLGHTMPHQSKAGISNQPQYSVPNNNSRVVLPTVAANEPPQYSVPGKCYTLVPGVGGRITGHSSGHLPGYSVPRSQSQTAVGGYSKLASSSTRSFLPVVGSAVDRRRVVGGGMSESAGHYENTASLNIYDRRAPEVNSRSVSEKLESDASNPVVSQNLPTTTSPPCSRSGTLVRQKPQSTDRLTCLANNPAVENTPAETTSDQQFDNAAANISPSVDDLTPTDSAPSSSATTPTTSYFELHTNGTGTLKRSQSMMCNKNATTAASKTTNSVSATTCNNNNGGRNSSMRQSLVLVGSQVPNVQASSMTGSAQKGKIGGANELAGQRSGSFIGPSGPARPKNGGMGSSSIPTPAASGNGNCQSLIPVPRSQKSGGKSRFSPEKTSLPVLSRSTSGGGLSSNNGGNTSAKSGPATNSGSSRIPGFNNGIAHNGRAKQQSMTSASDTKSQGSGHP